MVPPPAPLHDPWTETCGGTEWKSTTLHAVRAPDFKQLSKSPKLDGNIY